MPFNGQSVSGNYEIISTGWGQSVTEARGKEAFTPENRQAVYTEQKL